jgi:hypothetical protein
MALQTVNTDSGAMDQVEHFAVRGFFDVQLEDWFELYLVNMDVTGQRHPPALRPLLPEISAFARQSFQYPPSDPKARKQQMLIPRVGFLRWDLNFLKMCLSENTISLPRRRQLVCKVERLAQLNGPEFICSLFYEIVNERIIQPTDSLLTNIFAAITALKTKRILKVFSSKDTGM